jgi:hypothetical protein
MINQLAWRRRQVQRFIDADPWDITFVRSALDGDGEAQETTYSFVGRVHAAGPNRGVEDWSRRLTAEQSIGAANACVIAPYDADIPTTRDSVTAEHRASGIIKYYRVSHGTQYPEKVEVILIERE